MIVAAALPVLLIVTDCAADVEPTFCAANVRLLGDADRLAEPWPPPAMVTWPVSRMSRDDEPT